MIPALHAFKKEELTVDNSSAQCVCVSVCVCVCVYTYVCVGMGVTDGRFII